MPVKRRRECRPWPTDYILSARDRRYRRYFGIGTAEFPYPLVSPDEPKNLAQYLPEQWPCKCDWHAARSTVAQSLGRQCLPEISAMIGQGPLADYTGGPEPTGGPETLFCW
jgi:hypothetical protein